jgi:hypothetical protein
LLQVDVCYWAAFTTKGTVDQPTYSSKPPFSETHLEKCQYSLRAQASSLVI